LVAEGLAEIAAASDFDELYAALDSAKTIKDSHEKAHTSGEMRKEVEILRKIMREDPNSFPEDDQIIKSPIMAAFTRSHGLRAKIAELLARERNKPSVE